MGRESGGRASNAWATCPWTGDNPAKAGLIPNAAPGGIFRAPKAGIRKDLPSREGPMCHQLVGGVTAHQGIRLAGLRGRPAALGLRHCPDSYGRLQSRIIRNGRKPDDATLRGGRRPSGCKLLSWGKKVPPANSRRARWYPKRKPRLTLCQQPR